jgi:beta-lactamase regulating signal transducer with metallopeptidase domain
MTNDLIWVFIFNLIINSFFTFLTIAILIQLVIYIFRIRSSRAKVILLCIPFLKLAFDPFLYDFQNWALLQKINPIEAEIGSRSFSMQIGYPLNTGIVIGLFVNNVSTFSLADLAAVSLNPFVIRGVVVITLLITLVLLSIFALRLHKSISNLSEIVKKSSLCTRPLKNQKLIEKIERNHSQLILSSEVKVPCAFGIVDKWICFPEDLVDHLTQEEFEAIIAHELDHLYWYDGVISIILVSFCTLFWWIPTKRWLKQLEFAQEMACDVKSFTLECTPLHLASAMLKSASAAKNRPTFMLSTCFIEKGSVIHRLQALSEGALNKTTKSEWLKVSIAGVVAIAILFGRFWIF